MCIVVDVYNDACVDRTEYNRHCCRSYFQEMHSMLSTTALCTKPAVRSEFDKHNRRDVQQARVGMYIA